MTHARRAAQDQHTDGAQTYWATAVVPVWGTGGPGREVKITALTVDEAWDAAIEWAGWYHWDGTAILLQLYSDDRNADALRSKIIN